MTDEIAPQVSHSPEAEAASLPAAERPKGQEPLGDRMFAGMGDIYEKHMARAEREAKTDPAMPPARDESKRTLNDSMAAAYDWTEKPKAERVREFQTDAELEFRRAEAKRYGVTLEEYGQIEQTAALKNLPGPQEYQAAMEPLRSIFPDQQPEATAKWMADVVKSARGNPRAFIPWLAQQLGVDAASLGAPNADQAAISAANDFLRDNPDAAELRKEMAEAIERGEVSHDQAGDHKALFAKAYQHVKARKAASKPKPRAERRPFDFGETMEAVYDQVTAR